MCTHSDSIMTPIPGNRHWQLARQSRDSRFDGKFFVAVKTTKIYCRPICRVRLPKEENVLYFDSAFAAASHGFRPCLRCRPDSAPGSPAWKGTGATLSRAMSLLQTGAQHDMPRLAERLGISDRYLRHLFQNALGVSPKRFALYHQCLFAKKLLHETVLPITDVALASGFTSVRRFNDCFKQLMTLTPSGVRKTAGKIDSTMQTQLTLSFRPPYDWDSVRGFLQSRLIQGLEWCNEHSYGRSFSWEGSTGEFTATYTPEQNAFIVNVRIDQVEKLQAVITNIRRMLDVDADIAAISAQIQQAIPEYPHSIQAPRLPGIWSSFEAAIRAVLGQQVSVQAARNLVQKVVDHHQLVSRNELGEERKLFPTAEQWDMQFVDSLKMPQRRKQTLNFVAEYFRQPMPNVDEMTQLAGIGPWTRDYVLMRGESHPDIYLAGDLGVKKAEEKLESTLKPEAAAPWRTYLTLFMWKQL